MKTKQIKGILSVLLSIILFVSMTGTGVGALADNITKVKYGAKYSATIGESTTHKYSFTVPVNGKVKLSITVSKHLYYYIYDGHYNKVLEIWPEYNPVTDNCKYSNNLYLKAGTYYLLAQNIYLGSANYFFVMKYAPSFSNTSISKTVPLKKGFKVYWKKAANVGGFQVQYSMKKNMGGAKTINVKNKNSTVRTVKKLKSRKRYYVRVRSYRIVKVNGTNKTYYGKWSKKSVLTK